MNVGRVWRVVARLAAIVVFLASPALAQSDTSDRWRVIVSPYAWAASLDGDLTLAGLHTNVDVPFSEIFDHLDFVAMGEVEVAKGRWGVIVDGQHVKTSQDEKVLANRVDLGIETTNVDVAAYYRVYERELGGATRMGGPRHFAIEPYAGARWTRLTADVSALGLQTRKTSEWTDIIVGARSDYDLTDRWNLSGAVDLGSNGQNGSSINARAMIGYGGRFLGRPTQWKAGYRLLWQKHRADDFTGGVFRWDVTRQGPVAGFSMHF
ncbi:MAG: hypothetical protein J7521_12505 [Caulobacter sp.]|nr:hypothetical protein [Caulobacter sp.]